MDVVREIDDNLILMSPSFLAVSSVIPSNPHKRSGYKPGWNSLVWLTKGWKASGFHHMENKIRHWSEMFIDIRICTSNLSRFIPGRRIRS